MSSLSQISYISIDQDAFEKPEDEKYVLFLSRLRLDDPAWQIIEDFTAKTIERLGQRTRNCINALGYRDFLVNYLFARDMKLLNLRNFGKKSIFEINEKNVKGNIKNLIKETYSASETDTIDNFLADRNKQESVLDISLEERYGEMKAKLIRKECDRLIEMCSRRVKNAIGSFNKRDDFAKRVLSPSSFDVKSIKNLGKRSEMELADVIDRLSSFAKNLGKREISDEESAIIKKKGKFGSLLDSFSLDFYKENGYLPMFHIVENALRNLVKTRNYGILNYKQPFFANEESIDLDVIGEKYNLTRERVRQIVSKSKNVLTKQNDAFRIAGKTYTSILLYKEEWKYLIDIEKGADCITLTDMAEVLEKEQSQLSGEYIMLLVSIILEDTHTVVGLQPMNLKNRVWKNTYIINKVLASSFDFGKVPDSLEYFSEENYDDVKLSAEDMLLDDPYGLWKDMDFSLKDSICFVLSKILTNELGLVPDFDDKFTILGKKTHDIGDVVYDILKESGKPVSEIEIFNKVNSIYPYKWKDVVSMHNALSRDVRISRIFQSKEYGLSEWDNVEYGSIRNVIVNYLSQFDEPQSLDNIVAYVLKHRDTNERSIKSSMETGDQFCELTKGFYGLTSKSYEKWERERWLDVCEKYMEFVKTRHKRPGYVIGETDLYYWFEETKKEFEEGSLAPWQTSKYIELCNLL